MAASKLAQALAGGNTEEIQAQEPSGTSNSAEPGSYRWMLSAARDLNIPGRSTMDKASLADAIAKALPEHGSKRTRADRVAEPPATQAPATTSLAQALGGMPDPDMAMEGSEPTGPEPEEPQEAAPAMMPPQAQPQAPSAHHGGIPAALQARIQRMVQLGAPPEAVAQMLNQALAQ